MIHPKFIKFYMLSALLFFCFISQASPQTKPLPEAEDTPPPKPKLLKSVKEMEKDTKDMIKLLEKMVQEKKKLQEVKK